MGRSMAEGKEAGGGHRPVGDFDAQAEHLCLEGEHVLAEWAAEVVQGRAQRLALGQTQHQHQWWWGPVDPLGLADGVTRGVITAGSAGDAAYLDTGAVEPGVGAGGTDQGVIARPLRHRLLADEAQGLVPLQRPHPLHRPVLPAEGPADGGDASAPALLNPGPGSGPAVRWHSLELPKELGDAAPLAAAGVVEGAGTAPGSAGDRGARLAADAAPLGMTGGWMVSVPHRVIEP